jgi:heme/copper-type cytochrome/quinol oxidase subunit 3
MEASAPRSANVQAEPPDWQPHAVRFGARLLCGSITFFFVAFLFAYFYLLALNTNGHFRIGQDQPSVALGTAIAGLLLIGAIVYRLAARRPFADILVAGIVALLCTLAAVALQFYEYTTIGFGAASGGYAAVFFGWTGCYAVLALVGAYWIEVQVASLARERLGARERRSLSEGVPADDDELLRAGVEASSFYWAYFVAIGVIAFIVLYLV